MASTSSQDLGGSSSSVALLVGAGDDRWSLRHAVDALVAAARQAGHPSLVWVAGFFYPTLSLGFGNLELQLRNAGGGIALDEDELAGAIRDPWLGVPLVLAPVLLPIVMRLIAGLARIATPSAWRELCRDRRSPRLRDAWRAGSGHALASLGLWFQLLLMIVVAGAALIVPPYFFLIGTGLQPLTWPFLLLIGPFVGVMMVYALLLSVIYQLSLHSLAQNHRGVSSALVHAWRIVRNDPWATARATLVDFSLYLTMLVLGIVASTLLAITCIGIPLLLLVWPLVVGFAGTPRAAYWARAYRALGGLSPDDQVPGLAVADRV